MSPTAYSRGENRIDLDGTSHSSPESSPKYQSEFDGGEEHETEDRASEDLPAGASVEGQKQETDGDHHDFASEDRSERDEDQDWETYDSSGESTPEDRPWWDQDQERGNSDQGWTSLHDAADCGNLEKAYSLIIQHPTDIQATVSSSGETPLHIAAKNGHTEMVDALLKHGADIMARDYWGQRPLELVLDSGSRFGKRRGNRDAAALMLLKNMTEEQALEQSEPSQPPLLCKVSAQKCIECVHWILRYETSKIVLAEPRHGRTLLYDIIALGYDYSEVAMLLFQYSAPIKGVSAIGNTALHYAAQAGMSDVVKALLHSGSSHEPPVSEALHMRNSKGHRPLECACAGYDPGRPDSEEIVILLISQDRSPDSFPDEDEGWTALHWAVFYNRPDLVSLLVSKGAAVQARDYSQRTPADLAKSNLRHGKISEMMQWLQPSNTKVQGRENGGSSLLTRPRTTQEIEILLDHVPFYIADVYRGGSIETSGFSLRSILYEFGPNHVMQVAERMSPVQLGSTKDEFVLRWVHLPANNNLIQSIYYDQQTEEVFEFDHEQLHDRYFKNDRQGRRSPSPGSAPVVAQIVFEKMRQCIEQNFTKVAGSVGGRFLQPFFSHFRAFARETGPTGASRPEIEHHRMALSMPFLCFKKFKSLTLADNWNSIRSSLERHYAKGESMHLPLMLDHFYYHAPSESADKRAKKQVLFRHQGRIAENERVVCMVDQLWIHVANENTIVTSCSANWERGERSATIDFQEILRTQLLNGKDTRPPLLSHLGMIPLAIAACIRDSMVLNHKQNEGEESLLQVFGDAIARATDEEVRIFTGFMTTLSSNRSDSMLTREARDREITGALELLNGVKDILYELNIIKTVLFDQNNVMVEAFQNLDRWSEYVNRGGILGFSEQYAGVSELTSFYRSYSRIDTTSRDVNNLIETANQVAQNINRLLDLRQKHANLTEAMWSRQASEDTTRQGRTIMVFTVVTIVFLPITFLSSLFALDITVFPHDDEGELSYTPRWAFSWLFGLTIAVSLPLVLIAFFVNDIGGFISRLKSRRLNEDAPAHQNQEEASQAAIHHGEQKVRKKDQNGWKLLPRKRTTNQGALSNV